MDILIAGASGFIGSALVKALEVTPHRVTVLGRSLSQLRSKFPLTVKQIDWDNLNSLNANNFDVVINLCGSNIGEKRWNESVKKQLMTSRITTNQRLIQWVINNHAKPHYLCANAVGIYGLQDKDDLASFDEDTVIDLECADNLLSQIGTVWQQSLQPAIDKEIPVTSMRFGVVLERGLGMMKKLETSFYLGLGAVIGDGRQTISWVHIDDVINAILFLLAHPMMTGAVNITSPFPVNQRVFAQQFARVIHRPMIFKIPDFVIRLLFGEMGECLLLQGQRVIPKRLLEAGYCFSYPDLNKALENLYPRKRKA